jgi:hypothetical protein
MKFADSGSGTNARSPGESGGRSQNDHGLAYMGYTPLDATAFVSTENMVTTWRIRCAPPIDPTGNAFIFIPLI